VATEPPAIAGPFLANRHGRNRSGQRKAWRACARKRSDSEAGPAGLEPATPVLESSAPRVHRGTMEHKGSGNRHLRRAPRARMWPSGQVVWTQFGLRYQHGRSGPFCLLEGGRVVVWMT